MKGSELFLFFTARRREEENMKKEEVLGMQKSLMPKRLSICYYSTSGAGIIGVVSCCRVRQRLALHRERNSNTCRIVVANTTFPSP